jgi:hypothetical protein
MEVEKLWSGWEAPTALRFEEVEDVLCRSRGVAIRRLMGSRVGGNAPLRSVLIALGVDVLLVPVSICANAYAITVGGAVKSADRGRRMLAEDEGLRAELAAVLGPTLGVVVPE